MLTVRRCVYCDQWVASYGGLEVEDDCPITAVARCLEIVAADVSAVLEATP